MSDPRLIAAGVALAVVGAAAFGARPACAAEACDNLDASFRGQVILGDFAVADGDVARAGTTYVQALADALTLSQLCAADDAATADRRAAFEAMRRASDLDRKFVDLLAASQIPQRVALSAALRAIAETARSEGRQAAAQKKPLTAEAKFELAGLYFEFAAQAALAGDDEVLWAARTSAAKAASGQRCARLTDEADSFVRYAERSEELWVNGGEPQARFDAVEIYRVAAARLRDLKAECGASGAAIDSLLGEIETRVAMLR